MITLIYSNFVTVMWLVCALFFIRIVEVVLVILLIELISIRLS